MTTDLDEKTVLRVAPNVYARSFGTEVVLLDFGRGEYFGLDEIGAEVWRGIEGGNALGTIADGIAHRFTVSSEEALRDIVDLVKELREQRLVM